MNDLMKEVVAGSGTEWAATLPLVLFVAFFAAVVIWTMAQPAEAPPLE